VIGALREMSIGPRNLLSNKKTDNHEKDIVTAVRYCLEDY